MSLETGAHESKTRLLVICVNYFNNEETLGYIQSLFRQQQSEYLQVIAVDNSNTLKDHDVSFLPSRIAANTFIFNPDKNLGYLNGAAWGLERYLTTHPMPEWVVVSNTDINFLDSFFFEKLFTYYPKGFSGVVAPSIILEHDMRNQNPYRTVRPSKAKIFFYKTAYRCYLTAVLYQLAEKCKKEIHKMMSKPSQNRIVGDQPMAIYAPHGSFIIFHRTYFQRNGTLKYGAFLYNEELFVAETARQLGLNVIYDPRLSVVHREHQTTSLIRSRDKMRYHKQSLACIYDSYYGSHD